MPEWKTPMQEIPIGKGRKIKDGEGIAILSLGHPGNFVTAAIRELKTEGLNPAHYDMRFCQTPDEELLQEIFSKYDRILTVEDGTVIGGFGSAILEFQAAHHYTATIRIWGSQTRSSSMERPRSCKKNAGMMRRRCAAAIREMIKIK